MKPVEPVQTSRRPGGMPARGHAATLLAVYSRGARTGRALRLNIRGHSPAGAELQFLPLAASHGVSGSLGLLHTSSGYRLRMARFEVVVVGKRRAEPAEMLIAGRLPKRIAGQPGAVLRGFAKSVVRAHADLQWAGGELDGWRAALLLALDGELPQAMLEQAEERPAVTGDGGNTLLKDGDWLVWRPHVERLAQKLVEQASRLASRNPYADALTPETAAAMIDTGNLRMARLALAYAAREHGWSETNLFGETAFLLADRGRKSAAAAEAGLAQQILEAVERGEGGLTQLRSRYKGSPHVISRLLEARRLVCSADGFAFTRDELQRYWTQLQLGPGSAAPGVGELKDSLGLKRRKAEGLRRLLADRLSLLGPAGAAGEGR